MTEAGDIKIMLRHTLLSLRDYYSSLSFCKAFTTVRRNNSLVDDALFLSFRSNFIHGGRIPHAACNNILVSEEEHARANCQLLYNPESAPAFVHANRQAGFGGRRRIRVRPLRPTSARRTRDSRETMMEPELRLINRCTHADKAEQKGGA